MSRPELAGRRVSGAGSATALRRLLTLAAGAVLASAAIYLVGLPWLAVFTGLGLQKALSVGLFPFVLGDLLKAAVAVGAVYLGAARLVAVEAVPLLRDR